MKNLKQIIAAGVIGTTALNAQVKDHQLDVMNKLATPSHVSVMPVSQLLNAR